MNSKTIAATLGIVAGIAVIVFLVMHLHIHKGYVAQDKAVTDALITQFHTRLNTGAFDQIWDDADSSLKQSKTREEWKRLLQDVIDHTGKFDHVKDSKLNVMMGLPVQIRGAYRSSFEKGNFTELFAFVRRDEDVRLAYYSALSGSDTDIKHDVPEN
jgi:hypothetical protein